ncbi:MAG TPA: GspMb/PilO family protein [Longimicrobium sp.]|nr:GspMb/PilO family protein [Longimicrobium sp.]
MRMPDLGPRDRRAILIGAAVLAPAFAWTFAAGPYLAAVADAGDRLALERRLLGGELELLASASAYPKAFDAGAERLLAAAPRLMAGDDEGAAAAALAGYVRRLAQMGTANLTRVEPAASYDAGGGVRALPVGVTGETDLEGLLTFLQLLESGPKLVHVQELRLEASSTPAGGGAAYGGATAFYTPAAAPPEVITFRFTAVAFTLAAPADSAAVDVEVPEVDVGAVELRDAEAGSAP